jgi:hypothetical protein
LLLESQVESKERRLEEKVVMNEHDQFTDYQIISSILRGIIQAFGIDAAIFQRFWITILVRSWF